MAGSPRKRARKLGIPLPNAGNRPPKHPRARARDLSDGELTLLARKTLAHVMGEGLDDKDRVAAARVALESLRRPAPSSPSDDFERMTDDQLRAALGAEQGAPAGSTTQ